MGTVEVDKVLNRLLEIAQKETGADFAVLYPFEDGKITPQPHYQSEKEPNEQCLLVCDKLAQRIFEESQQLTLKPRSTGNENRCSNPDELWGHATIATPT